MRVAIVAAILVLNGAATTHGQTPPAAQSFTFVRINYGPAEATPRGAPGNLGSRWATDYPDAELELTKHLRSIAPEKLPGVTFAEPVVRRIGDADLAKFPLLYFTEPSSLKLSGEQARTLREYAEQGGLLMFDDFWGRDQWDAAAAQVRKIFPGREIKLLELSHPLFHLAYDLSEFPQVPSISAVLSGRDTEVADEPAHYFAVLADDGRILALLCHNTDLADGWERGGVNQMYYEKYSLAKAFPMAANVVAYVMKLKKAP